MEILEGGIPTYCKVPMNGSPSPVYFFLKRQQEEVPDLEACISLNNFKMPDSAHCNRVII